jgi:hypothetical protein
MMAFVPCLTASTKVSRIGHVQTAHQRCCLALDVIKADAGALRITKLCGGLQNSRDGAPTRSAKVVVHYQRYMRLFQIASILLLQDSRWSCWRSSQNQGYKLH